MPSFLSGRRRTIIISGTLNAEFNWYGEVANVADQPAQGVSGFADLGFGDSFKIQFLSVVGRPAEEAPVHDTHVDWAASISFTANPFDGFPLSVINQSGSTRVGTIPLHTTRTGSMSNAIEIRIDVEEVVIRDTPPDSSDWEEIEGYPFPAFNPEGSAIEDNLPASAHIRYERMRIGGIISMRVTGPVNLFARVTIDPLWATNIDTYMVDLDAEAESSETPAGTGLTAPTIHTDWHLNFCNTPISVVYSRSTGGCSAGGNSCNASATGNSSSGASCITYTGVSVPTIYELDARLRACDHAYPDTQLLNFQDKAEQVDPSLDIWTPRVNPISWHSDISYSFLQKNEYARSNINGTLDALYSSHEIAPIKMWLDYDTLVSTAEDDRDWVCKIHGRAFNSFKIGQNNPWVIDNCLSTDGWTGNNATISIASGHIPSITSFLKIVVNHTGTGGASKSFSHYNTEGWRYVDVRFKSVGSANQNLTIALGPSGYEKFYSRLSGNDDELVTLRCDLCQPQTLGSSVDYTDSRFPLDAPNGKPDPAEHGPGWGIDYIDSIVISGIPSDVVMEIKDIALVKDIFAKYTIQPAFYSFNIAWTSETDNTYYNPFFILNADGKISDWSAVYEIVPFSGDPSLNFYTISQLISDMSQVNGWTFTELPSDIADGYHNNGLLAYHIFGGGSIFEYTGETSGNWKDAWDLDVTSNPIIKSQDLFDIFYGFPMCGNYAGGFDYSATTPIPIKVTKVLRGEAWGLVFDDNTPEVPITGAHITATYAVMGGATVGAAVTDVEGFYTTHLPCGKSQNIRTECEQGSLPYPYHDRIWHNRKRDRNVFYDLTVTHDTVGIATIHFEATNEYIWAYTLNGDVWVGRSQVSIPVDGLKTVVQITTNGLNSQPELWIAPNGITYLGYYNGTNCVYRYSADRCKTWSDEVSLFTGCQQIRVATAPRGRKLFAAFKYNSGSSGPGKIRVIKMSEGGSFSTEANALLWNGSSNASFDVQDSGFDLSFSKGSFLLMCKKDGSSSHSFLSSKDYGSTFTDITPP